MAVEAGFQGGKFSPIIFDKIAEAKKIISQLDKSVELIVDGGVSLDNIEQLKDAGIENIAVGSALWKSDNLSETITNLLNT